MQALWRTGRATIHELVDALDTSAAYTTVLTMVRILEKKGYVAHDPPRPGQRAHVYYAEVAEDSARRHHVRDFIARFFGGRADELVAGVVADERIAPEALAELRRQIDARLSETGKPRRGRPRRRDA